jgi:amino acid efflux transporter
VPRRGLLLVAALVLGYTGAVDLVGIDLQPLVLVQTSSIVAVYLASTAAATRLLPAGGWGRRAAWCGVVATTALAVAAGWHLVAPVVLALAAVLVSVVKAVRRRSPR